MGEPFDSEDLRKVALSATQALQDGKMHINRSMPLTWNGDVTQDWVDDVILQAHMNAPVWSDYAIVKKRPNLYGLAFYASNIENERISLISDDSFVVFHDNKIIMLFTLVTRCVRDEIYYQIGFHCFSIDEEVLSGLSYFKKVIGAYGIIYYEDCKIIDESGFWGTGDGADEYIESPIRKRPVFICRRFGNITSASKNYLKVIRPILSTFGPVIANDNLFRRYCKQLSCHQTDIISISPNGQPVALKRDDAGGIALQLSHLLNGCEITSDMEFPLNPLGLGKCAQAAWSSVPSVFLPSLEEIEHKSSTYRQLWEDLLDRLAPKPTAPVPSPTEQHSANQPAYEALQALKPITLDADGYPVEVVDISQWAAETLSQQIIIAPRAQRALKRSRHPDPRRIAEALELLAGPKFRGYLGEHDTISEVEAGLLKLHLSDGFSNAERLKGQTGADYLIEVGGHRLLLERHLRSNSSGFNDPKMLRIYYVFDKRLQKIVVGWLPSHLRTSQS